MYKTTLPGSPQIVYIPSLTYFNSSRTCRTWNCEPQALSTTDPDNMRSRNAKPKINPATVNSRPVKSKKVSSKNTIQMPLASEDGDGERQKMCETGQAGPMGEVSDSVLYFWPNV